MPLHRTVPMLTASLLAACFTRDVPCPNGAARSGTRCLEPETFGPDAGSDGSAVDLEDDSVVEDEVEGEGTPLEPTDCVPGDEACDSIEETCEGAVDGVATNACGGPCSKALPHELGSACSNELLGACARAGVYVCDGTDSVRCNTPEGRPTPELCGDGIDNDCNGVVDEATAGNAVTWYQDCDGDGFANSVAGAVKSCVTPASVGSCAWTAVIPNQTSTTNWDCDDSSALYTPTATYGTAPDSAHSPDLNCDGQVTPDPSVVRSRFTACAQNILDWINKGGRRAWRTDNASNTANCPVLQLPNSATSADDFCTAWRDASGALVREPPSYCPDVAVTLSWTSRLIDTAGGYTGCSVNKNLGSLWPCR